MYTVKERKREREGGREKDKSRNLSRIRVHTDTQTVVTFDIADNTLLQCKKTFKTKVRKLSSFSLSFPCFFVNVSFSIIVHPRLESMN